METKAGAWIAFGAAVLLAVLMAPSLSAPALSDEVFTLEAAAKPLPELWNHLRADVHPPLYYLAVRVWLAAAGLSLEALRAFSLLMACVAALLAGFLLRRAEEGRWWAPWFIAADGILLMMAGYGRMYTLLAVLCLLAWIGSDWWLRGGNRGWSWLAAGAVAAGLCTHHFFGMFLAGLGAWAAMVHGRAAVRLAAPWAAGAAVWAAVWGRTAWEQITNRPDHLAWVPPVHPGAWALIVGTHLIFVLAALPAGLVVLAWKRPRPGGQWPKEARAAALAALLTLALPGVISLWKPVLNPRFTIIATPFLAVALAPLGTLTGGVLPAGAVAAAGVWLWRPQAGTQCTSAEAARQLAARTVAGDTVIFCRLTRKPIEYHWDAPAPRRRSFPGEIDQHPGYEGRQPPWRLEMEARELAASLTGRVFVVADTKRPSSQILLRVLEEAGWRRREPLLACTAEGRSYCYFNSLLVFDPPARNAGSPSGAPRGPGSPRPGPDAPAYARR